MSDTQGSHRRGAPVPEAYGGGPQARPARPADPGPSSWDTEPALPVPMPAPRAEDRRAGRRRRAADAGGRDGV
ncbi:hypothetical protein ACFXAG_35775, partial [Streptomyces yangpuensis]